MGLLDKLLGRDEAPQPQPVPAVRPATSTAPSADEQAISRYRYMLKTAPPETIEQAHAEAFAKLTPEQRTLLLQQLSADLPEGERSAAGAAARNDPQSLARLATRAEIRRPGTMERTFGGMGGRGGMGMGGMLAGSFLSTIAGVVVGSAIANAFFGDSGSDHAAAADGGANDAAADTTADTSADAGTDVADAGDFGGDDFGGGDFGEI